MTLPMYSTKGKKTDLEDIIPALQELINNPNVDLKKKDDIKKSLVQAQGELADYNKQIDENLEKIQNQILATEAAQLEKTKIEKETAHLFPYKLENRKEFTKAVQLRQMSNDRMNFEVKKLHSMLPTKCDWYCFPKIGRAVYSMNPLHADIQKI